MAMLEEKAITIARFKSDLWFRYIDNTFVLWNIETENRKECLSSNEQLEPGQKVYIGCGESTCNVLIFSDTLSVM